MSNEIHIYAGDSDKEIVTLTDQNGQAIDLTDYKIIFTVKRNVNLPAFVIQKKNVNAGGSSEQIEMHDPTNGKFKILLVSNDTESLLGQGTNYVYDVEIQLESFKKTAIVGHFIVEDDVTW